jgi:hypothetical protein
VDFDLSSFIFDNARFGHFGAFFSGFMRGQPLALPRPGAKTGLTLCPQGELPFWSG